VFSREFLTQIAHQHQLSPDQERVFLLRFAEDQDYEEIAEQVETSKGACLKRMGQVYKKFGIEGGTRGKESELRAFLDTRWGQNRAAAVLGLPVNSSSQMANGEEALGLGPTSTPIARLTTRARVSRKVAIFFGDRQPDQRLLEPLKQAIAAAGHQLIQSGDASQSAEKGLVQLQGELQTCDQLLLLLSGQSAFSDLSIEQVHLARELQETRKDSTPHIFAIRINWPAHSPVSYDLRVLLQGIPQREWRSPLDTSNLVREVLQAIETGSLPQQFDVESAVISALTPTWESADGRPLPFAGPELPEGQVDLASPFYVNRPPIEERCYEMILQPGALIRIKAPRQMGKTSLMARILNHASNHGYCPVHLSFHLADKGVFSSLDKFLKWFCAYIGQQLQLPNQLPEYWDDFLGSNVNCKSYFEDYLLKEINTPLALCLDEVDRVFQHPDIADDFFGLLRAWHEESKRREIWKKLRLVVVHSTEVYIPMNINQSPFNVGLPIELPEFTPNLVQDLSQRYGINWCETDVSRLMNMVGGHPFLVRLALYHIARQDITLETLLKTAPTEAGFYNDHLRRHLWNLEQHPLLAKAMKEVVFSPTPVRLPSEQAFKLHSMGLVKFQGNDIVERCDLYRQYFRNRLDE
jgi:hypothetical protein